MLFRCLPSTEARAACSRAAAASFSLPPDSIADWVISEKPQIHIDSTALHIGRLVLPAIPADSSATSKQAKHASPFCHTALALRLMEAACACVQQNEPVLLTGETGEEHGLKPLFPLFSHARHFTISLCCSSTIDPQCICRNWQDLHSPEHR